jgi:hypothetical protein
MLERLYSARIVRPVQFGIIDAAAIEQISRCD